MKFDNGKVYKDMNNKETLKKMIMVSLTLALVAGICGCTKSKDDVLAKGVSLDENMIDEETTTAMDRYHYYDENYDSYLNDMTVEEKKQFMVHVYVDTVCSEENLEDEIMFLRNDSTYVGSVPAEGGELFIPLGDYKLISLLAQEDKLFGSLKVLESEKTVKLHVDINQKTSEYSILA